jgi:hypothetical protein
MDFMDRQKDSNRDDPAPCRTDGEMPMQITKTGYDEPKEWDGMVTIFTAINLTLATERWFSPKGEY